MDDMFVFDFAYPWRYVKERMHPPAPPPPPPPTMWWRTIGGGGIVGIVFPLVFLIVLLFGVGALLSQANEEHEAQREAKKVEKKAEKKVEKKAEKKADPCPPPRRLRRVGWSKTTAHQVSRG